MEVSTISKEKNLHIITYGCQMNVYDSARMEDLLAPFGYKISDKPDNADIVILNTCNIREKASEKVYSELGYFKKFKEAKKAAGQNMIIVIAGCVGQAEGEEVFKRAPHVDIVVGPQSYHSLPKLIEKIEAKEKRVTLLDFTPEPKFDSLPEESKPQGISAFLTIQEGCDKFCKFCCVPYTRGPEYSRPVHEIHREAIRIVSQGTKEITLLGQNVSSYQSKTHDGQNYNLAKLIKHLATIKGLERIRYTTSHPNDFDDELIELHATEPKLMPYLHLPVQSGSNKVLHNMNRKHTWEKYIELINKFRQVRPDMAFSSDFIVGYPGETEEDFQDTLSLVQQVKYAQCYSFKYSIRPGTTAATLPNQIDEDIKAQRLNTLQKLLHQQQEEFNKSKVGQKLMVLFEKKGKHKNQIVGKTEYMQTIHVYSNDNLIGQIKEVMVENCNSNTLNGVLVKE
jgi:tRNA-2-methylthio-N6-dimethylallyladenosine synthase